jgi:tetratricopeptide (TPR) repeat protein
MASEAAQRAKTQGSTAWSVGQYAQAAEHFTTAINCGGDKEFLKLLYSNRSAAYIKLNRFDESLKDANKCVELDSQWAKGYTRKGDALYALKRYTDSYNAYNAGLRIAPNDASLLEKAEISMRAIRNESSSRTDNTSSTSEDTRTTRYARLAIIALGFIYLLPILPYYITSLAYRLSAGIFAGLQLLGMFRRTGYPSLSMEYGVKVMQDPSVTKIFLGFMLAFMPRHYFFCIIPIMLTEATHFLKEIFEVSDAPSQFIFL